MQNLSLSRKSVAPCIPMEESTTNRHLVLRRRMEELKGTAASSGVVEGPCTVIRNLEDLHTLETGRFSSVKRRHRSWHHSCHF